MEYEMKNVIGARIKSLRKQRQLTLNELKGKVNMSASFLCDIEKGRAMPSYDNLKCVASALNSSLSYLLGEIDYADLLSPLVFDLAHQLNQSAAGQQLLPLLADFPCWNEEEQQELLAYLRVKKAVRNIGNTETHMDAPDSGNEKEDSFHPDRTDEAKG